MFSLSLPLGIFLVSFAAKWQVHVSFLWRKPDRSRGAARYLCVLVLAFPCDFRGLGQLDIKCHNDY